MSLITLIDNIPLYTTIEEANIWGSQYNMTGYHTHIYNSITGYMPGENHDEIKEKVSQGIKNFLTSQQLASGNFVVTAEAIKAYYKNQPGFGSISVSDVLQSQQPSPAVTQQPVQQPVQLPVQPPIQPVVPTPPSTPSYTPPSTGGGSSGGGGY